VLTLSGPPNSGRARPYSATSMIFWYGMAYATACRTLGLSNGFILTFMPMYWTLFSISELTTFTFLFAAISAASLGVTSKDTSTSPR
jgi:hypothetical protein